MDLRTRCRPGERLVHAVFLLVALMLAAQRIGAQPTPIISRIRIVGNQRVEEDAIRIHISAQPGQPLNEAVVDQDVKAIYRMGFFTDVHATVDQQGGQAILTYHVKERPLITDVRTEGMKEIKPTADEVVGAIKLHSGVIEIRTRASDDPGAAAGLPGQGLSRRRHHVSHRARSRITPRSACST